VCMDRNGKVYCFNPHENPFTIVVMHKKKGKTIFVTGRRGLSSCETSGPAHFLDNLLTDGSEVVNLTCRSPFNPRKIPDTHFCSELS
jgi:hypothetical protein